MRCTFSDAELSEEADPEQHIIHDGVYYLKHAAKETNKAVKAFGETRKRAMDFVVGGTQFLMNKTERISFSLKSYMNGEGEENASRHALSESASAVSLTGSQKPRLRIETQSIPVLEESSEDPEMVYEVRKNIDEDSDESSDAVHVASS